MFRARRTRSLRIFVHRHIAEELLFDIFFEHCALFHHTLSLSVLKCLSLTLCGEKGMSTTSSSLFIHLFIDRV